MEQKAPDVFLVILDCVRAQELPGGKAPIDGLPNLEAIHKSALRFPNAVTVASWTIPSHASLFSGLYPWNHGAYSGGDLRLGGRVPLVQSILRQRGYATASFSANRFIGPEFGFSDGFDTSLWGGSWWGVRMHSSGSQAAANGSSPNGGESHGVRKVLDIVAKPLWSHPFPLDIINQMLQSVRNKRGDHAIWSAPWLEPALERWAGKFPASKPLFGFLNLLDAHEPYLTEPSVIHNAREWLSYARTAQRAIMGYPDSVQKKEGLALLHSLYCERLRAIDARVGYIVDILRQSNRWEDSLFILASDHGQGFGEGGTTYHEPSVDDSVLRIPLWVKFPGNRWGGTEATSWASLVDVMPTVLAEVGSDVPGPMDGYSFEFLRRSERPLPAFAMADWIRARPKHHDSPLNGEPRRMLPVVAYHGHEKTILNPETGELTTFPENDACLPHKRDQGDPRGGVVRTALSEVARRIMVGADTSHEALTIERLSSWGYG